jgi:hypothetical protein
MNELCILQDDVPSFPNKVCTDNLLINFKKIFPQQDLCQKLVCTECLVYLPAFII